VEGCDSRSDHDRFSAHAADSWKAILHSFVEELSHARRHSYGLDGLFPVGVWQWRPIGLAKAAILLTDLRYEGCNNLHRARLLSIKENALDEIERMMFAQILSGT